MLEFEIVSRTSAPPAEERLTEFIAHRPARNRRLPPPYSFIGQWGKPGERATCSIAARLNGLIGLGSVATQEAQVAHDELALGQAFTWTYRPDFNLYFPGAGSQTYREAFNKTSLPCRVELSDMVFVSALGNQALTSFLVQTAQNDIAVVLGRVDMAHDFVAVPAADGMLHLVDSRRPESVQAQEPAQTAAFLSVGNSNYLQFIYNKV